MAGEEKTEKATPKKRRDSRKKGEVLQSKEVSNAVFIVGIFVFLSIFGSTMFSMLLDYMEHSLESIGNTGNSVEFMKNIIMVRDIEILSIYLKIGKNKLLK